MPYVLKHNLTSQIYTCTLINGYRLPYYGTKYWDDEDTAAAEALPFLLAQSVDNGEAWEPLELTENQLKMCNVKLKNDPQLSLYWDDENRTLRVSASPSGS
ncbi:hypothetical protein [Paenibacillus piri]|uniref:hypothetical protein n=1 Tax=Paenibacillus piri TaxID=2547395 RepID=UPI001404D781|nr:hypothetical protein [Paenibacillus piri]